MNEQVECGKLFFFEKKFSNYAAWLEEKVCAVVWKSLLKCSLKLDMNFKEFFEKLIKLFELEKLAWMRSCYVGVKSWGETKKALKIPKNLIILWA